MLDCVSGLLAADVDPCEVGVALALRISQRVDLDEVAHRRRVTVGVLLTQAVVGRGCLWIAVRGELPTPLVAAAPFALRLPHAFCHRSLVRVDIVFPIAVHFATVVVK